MKHYNFDGVLGLMLGLLIGFGVTMGMVELTQNHYEKQAVERGYAEWSVASDGKTTWAWKVEEYENGKGQ